MPVSVVDRSRDSPQGGTGPVSRQVVSGDADACNHWAVVNWQHQERRASAVVSIDKQRVRQRRPEI